MNRLFIVWNKDFETGIDILDEQHRGLVSLINSFFFHRADTEDDISRVLVPTAEMLKAYVTINCATVEMLMREAGYPHLDKYRKIHSDRIHELEITDRRLRARRDAQGLLAYLRENWTKTIKANKEDYIPFLLEYVRSHDE